MLYDGFFIIQSFILSRYQVAGRVVRKGQQCRTARVRPTAHNIEIQALQ